MKENLLDIFKKKYSQNIIFGTQLHVLEWKMNAHDECEARGKGSILFILTILTMREIAKWHEGG
jgi:hypothetical protein